MAAARSAAESALPGLLGILGGTFNPPHLAHLALARAALSELEPERVLIVPARLAPQKTPVQDPGREHRLRMCMLAFGGEPGLEVSTVELERPSPSYTVDTLRHIRATNPDAKLVLITGADTAVSLPRWREPAPILELAELAVAGRDELARRDVRDAVRSVDPSAQLTFLQMPALGVSSSIVRARVAAGEPVEELVGASVARYIHEHELYRTVVVT